MQMKCARNGTFFNEEKVRGDIGPFLDDRHKKVEEGLVNERTEGEWAKASNTALRPNYAGDAVPGILPGRCGKTVRAGVAGRGALKAGQPVPLCLYGVDWEVCRLMRPGRRRPLHAASFGAPQLRAWEGVWDGTVRLAARV